LATSGSHRSRCLNSSGDTAPLAERWDGTTWHVQPTPHPGAAQGSGFGAVSCPSSSFCMTIDLAVDQASHPYLWNGTKMIDLGTLGGCAAKARRLSRSGRSHAPRRTNMKPRTSLNTRVICVAPGF
jgi:hypothetical protein